MTDGRSVQSGKVIPEIKMTGKTVLITGANCGLGLASAIDLAKRGARVIMACRNMEKGTEAKEKAEELSGSANVVVMELDLASMDSIRKFANDFLKKESRLDVLMNNAGVSFCPPHSITKDGFERHFGVNHLGHFLLTNLLLDLIKKSAPSRIVTVSSQIHSVGEIHWDDMNLTTNYKALKGYSQSKLMNILFSRQLSKCLEGTGVTTYSLAPGMTKTDIFRHIGTSSEWALWNLIVAFAVGCMYYFLKSPEDGAQTQIYCSVAPELENISGKYYTNFSEAAESPNAQNDEYAQRLWSLSEEYTGLK